MKADEIVRMLAAKHHDAVFVDECKIGSTWHGADSRLDAWALLKTWTPVTAIGYEVKVSRADFLRDVKWTRYLPVCHEFYFVAPKGVIELQELPEHVGLLQVAGSRLTTKRKAPRRELQGADLVSIMAYALMSRSRIVANWHEANAGGEVEWWRGWLAERADAQNVGHAASKRLREIVQEQKHARKKAEDERDRLLAVKATLVELGFDGNIGSWKLERQAGREALIADMAQVKRQLEQIVKAITRDLAAHSTAPEQESQALADEVIAKADALLATP